MTSELLSFFPARSLGLRLKQQWHTSTINEEEEEGVVKRVMDLMLRLAPTLVRRVKTKHSAVRVNMVRMCVLCMYNVLLTRDALKVLSPSYNT